ncbi:SGNH/GDSL hydrolase family protein [Micromonospora aurantiaca (nom. illeg.)]|uniref:SGNH/GDSL hydrolase family protein n=1 Tax=Micromonospora aurantiaca (nom. illeg.) TaxID=47850 RepID=UPI003445B516
MRKWWAALAGRYTEPVSVVVMGDSNSEGTGATTSVHRRWQQVLQAQLRARFQPPGVKGAAVPYISASPRMYLVPDDYERTATAGVGESSYGLGQRSATIPAGESVTMAFVGRHAKLHARKGPEVGRYRIVLDGGTPVVVDGAAQSGVNGQVIWDSGMLPAGRHTVQVSRDPSSKATAAAVYPEGLMTYDGDEAAGVRVVDSARGGAKVGDFIGLNAWNWYQPFGALPAKGLLILPWGANDATSGTSPEAFRAGLEALIVLARGNGFAGSVLLVHMPKRGTASEQVWADYRTQMEAIAGSDPDVAVLDLRARIPDQGTPEAAQLGVYVDEVHFTDRGQAMIADQIASAILPR